MCNIIFNTQLGTAYIRCINPKQKIYLRVQI